MIYCALRSTISIVALIGILMSPHSAASCFDIFDGKENSIPIALSPHKTTPIYISSWKMSAESGTKVQCSATITVPVSAFPSARLVPRPADFASYIRETLKEWDVNECQITVWLNNDTGAEFEPEELCLIESFRYDGDSVWSASSEEYCYSDAFVL